MEAKILSFARLQTLRERHHEALSAAGFEVHSVGTSEAAEDAIRRERIDVVVLGYSVAERERNRIAALAKKRNPEAVVVMVHLGAIHNAELADAILSVTSGTEDLVPAIKHLLERRRGGRRSTATG